MPTMDDVEAAVTAFPEVVEGTRRHHRAWAVGKNTVAWERPFTKADVKRFGAEPVPAGPIVAVAVADLGEKEAVLAAGTPGVLTIEHFKDYPAVLLDLATVPEAAMRELIEDAWLCQAPPALVTAYRTP